MIHADRWMAWSPFITEATNAGSAASVPTWFTMTVAIVGPLLLLLGVLIGHRVTRVSTKELDERARREELLRSVRWAAEQAVEGNPRAGVLGIATLRAMSHLPLLQTPSDQAFIDAVADAVVAEPAEVYRDLEPGRTIDVEVEGGY